MNHLSDNDLVCAVDLGGTNLRAANVDRTGRIHEVVRATTPETDKAEEIVKAIAAAVRQCEADGAKRGAEVLAFSVVVPGSVQAETGLVMNAPNVPSLPGFRLAEALRSELGRAVLIENDANAAALGEQWQGAARGCQTIICLTLGTGVGGGVILDGQLWRGIDGTAGEIGHMTVEPLGVPCKCGNNGCLEVYASATAIVRMARAAMALRSESSLHNTPAIDLSAERIHDAAVAGDRLAREVFQTAGRYLGIAMASVVNILNPEMIVVGGGVSAAWDLFAGDVRNEVMKRAFPVPAKRCQIVRAECGDAAGLLGAAWLAFQASEY